MSDTLQKLLNGDDCELENDTEPGITEIQNSEGPSAKETRLVTLKILLKKRRDRERNILKAVTDSSRRENNGHSTTPNDNGRTKGDGVQNEALNDRFDDTPHGSLPTGPNDSTSDAEPTTDERRLAKLERTLSSTLPTSEMLASQSMNLLDESANHMFDLMKGLHGNQPPAEIKAFDPDRVNSAVACANTIYKIMRLKLDAIKVQEKLTK
jgi:hypothetical protein